MKQQQQDLSPRPIHSFEWQRQYKGGGASSSTVTAASPPVTERATEVEAASRQSKTDAAKRKGFMRSFLAGETSQAQINQNLTKRSLLGG